MALIPADEKFDIQPRAALEDFYHLAMLKFGEPTHIEKIAVEFYKTYHTWVKNGTQDHGPWVDLPDAPTALLQYIVWYDREKQALELRGS